MAGRHFFPWLCTAVCCFCEPTYGWPRRTVHVILGHCVHV
ncbi:hypothetical protein KP509_34G049300 [Ceratopteris richardii]|uniref:Uncharacterized protein n=1 Tax=Ceratopteris richardii TaxID=49495 RepID=A0A8T2QLQ6_CERRI|nr:hypothetical protein KP509_34G049300 [Ceratopteris richardii]